jgi:GT2 family glycosyltransferase
VASVLRLNPPPLEIIAVADGDEEGARIAEQMGVRVIRRPVAGGPAAARNRAAQQALGDILFFLDADVTVAPDAMGRLARWFAEDPGVAAVIGSYDDNPAEPNFLSQYRNLFHHFVHQQSRSEASTFWGACGAIRRNIFQAMGGFDEGYRYPSVEDIELGYRLRRAEHRIRLDKDLLITHLKRWNARSIVRTDFFHRALPWTDLILQNRRFVNDLNLRTTHRMSVACVGLFLAGLIGMGIHYETAFLAAFCALALLTLNYPVYRFFWRKRGLWFAFRTVPWHWFYYLYSGLAFAIGVGRFWLRHVSSFAPTMIHIKSIRPALSSTRIVLPLRGKGASIRRILLRSRRASKYF